MRAAALIFPHHNEVSIRWPQGHEDPEDDNADYRHQNDVAVSFHCPMSPIHRGVIPAMPRMVPGMT